jgi:outer membrane protein insertion porin family
MQGKVYIGLVFLMVIASSCSVQRFLPPGEKLYKGSTITVEKNPAVKASNKQLRNLLKEAVKPRRNKFLLGQPYKVWWWYVIGEPDPDKTEKGLRSFLRKRLGEAPVLSSRINPTTTAENMESFMENIGYFRTAVQGDTVNTGYFVKARYTAQVQHQYTIKSITWVKDSSALLNLLERRQKLRPVLKVGQPYRLSDITAERDRLDLYLKTRGYYYFNPDYLMAYADSTIGDHGVDLYLNIKKSAPAMALHPYRVNRIVVFPNYSLASALPDTTMRHVEVYDSLLISDSSRKFKNSLFARTITYRPGRLYSSRSQNVTLNRLISLGSFKFVKNRFERVTDTIDPYRLDVFYYLTRAKTKSIQGAIDGFSRENNSLGMQLSVNWKHRNLFRGAEQLSIRAYTGFEVSSADSLRNNNSYRVGVEANIKFPQYVIPFLRIRENNFYPPNTNLLVGYELYRRQLFYTKNLFRIQYDFTWKKNIRNEFTLAPVSLSYLSATGITDTFYKQAAINPSLLVNVNSEVIPGSYFSYTYNNGLGRRRDKIYFNTSLDWAGNIMGLAMGSKGYREKEIFGTPFAQYVKVDFDFHYTRRLRNNWDWANRLLVGVGFPYNNSAFLPLTKQYIIGGSSSVRGFRVRSLGPGAHRPSAEDQRYYQVIGGDYKLLANTELRIPITGQISTALFLDAGNIWTKDTLLFGPAGQLSKSWFSEVAVAGGFGIRFDATVLIIRADLGIPLRKPYESTTRKWVFNQIDFTNKPWRRENLILNIALGLPF